MGDLLSKAEYAALAKDISLPSKAFINGAFKPAISGKTFATNNPATGAFLTNVAACSSEDVALAVSNAKEAFEDGRWRSVSPRERKAVLLKFANLLESHQHELAVLESLDSGKPVSECQLVDIPDTIHTIRWHAELIDKIYDNTAPVGSDALTMVVREPIGVVGCVLPWNFPLLMLAWKIGPALAAGCSVIVKPAEQTSLTTLRVAQLAFEAGVPAGVLNIVTGTGKDVGEPIGLHNDVDMVSFTGSTATGRRFLHYAADSNLKRIVLECGGKNPAVVMDDAQDLDLVAQHVVNGAFWNMGENCSATSRLIVHASVKDELLKRMGAYIREWKMGDPLDPENRVGSLVSPEHFAKVKSYLEHAAAGKLEVVYGGATKEGAFVEPTVIDGVGRDNRLFQEEIFGPILSVTTFNTISEAIALANDTVYGLAASVYTGSLRRAIKLSREIRAGIVTVNCFGEGDASTPFGGYKESGFGGRDKSIFAHDQYTEIKTIWIDVSDRSDEETEKMSTHTIKRLPVDTGVSGWEAISERTAPVRMLDGNVTADWLIIGAGFAGLSAARRLSQLHPGDSIVVVDAHEVAKGPAGRNSGFMIDVPHSLSSGEYSVASESATALEIAQNRFAIAFAAAAAREYGMSADTFDPSGKINAAATERGLKLNVNYAQSLERIGEKFQMFDAAQMREITGSAYYHGGIYTPGAVMIQPAQYIRDLAAGLEGKITLFERSPIIELTRQGSGWSARSHNGTVHAPKVILGVNGHIEDFGHYQGRLLHVFTYASMTAAYSDDAFRKEVPGKARWALLPADPMGATVRKISSAGLSRIVIRTKFTYDPSIQVTPERVAAVAKEQRHSLDARFPELKSTALEFSWAGRLCLSRNSAAAFGEIEENLYSACCENGLGTVKSTLAGVMAAELASGTRSEFLDSFSHAPGPSKLPPRIITKLGVSSVIRWHEFWAGREG